MNITYLPIRAFGDFIITASVVKDNFAGKIPVILPTYMEAIFEAIEGEKYFEVKGSINYHNQPAYYELYKIKDIKNIKRLIDDVAILRKITDKSQIYLLDYSSKRILWINSKFIWPNANENVYDGRVKLLQSKGIISLHSKPQNKITEFLRGKLKKVLILPDSRITTKSINKDLVKTIIEAFSDTAIHIAHFGLQAGTSPGAITYTNFTQLIDLISGYDLIISAESLPYHLANFLGRPHFVIYNESRHFNATFMTKFMINHNYYAMFIGTNTGQIVNQLAAILSNTDIPL